METTIVYWGYIGFIVPLRYIDYGFEYFIIRSPYTPYSIHLRGPMGLRVRIS